MHYFVRERSQLEFNSCLKMFEVIESTDDKFSGIPYGGGLCKTTSKRLAFDICVHLKKVYMKHSHDWFPGTHPNGYSITGTEAIELWVSGQNPVYPHINPQCHKIIDYIKSIIENKTIQSYLVEIEYNPIYCK